MSVTSVEKDLDKLTLTVVADVDASACGSCGQSVGQMDALLSD